MASESNPYLVVVVVFFFLTGFFLQTIGASLLIEQKTCFPKSPPGVQTVCIADDALKEASDMKMARNLLRELVPAIVVLWAGSWRDRTGLSKPLVLMAISGELIGAVFALISALAWNLNPWALVIVDSIVPGISGTRHLLSCVALPCITENVDENLRSTRATMMFVGLLGGACVGQAISGTLLKYANYEGYFVVVIVMEAIAFVMTIFVVKNMQKKKSEGGFVETIKRLRVVFKRRPNQLAIWCLMTPTFIISAILLCEGTVSAGFTNKVLGLHQDEASILTFYRLFIALV